MQTGAIGSIAIDVPPPALDALAKSDVWIHDDDAWRSILPLFPTQHVGYANQIRDTISKRKNEGAEYLLLHAVKEERVVLLNLKNSSRTIE